MEIYQLRAFVTAARLTSITRTAEALHLTQPAITAQIKALEEELGVALFDRRPGRINLTRAGEVLLEDAQQVLSSAIHLLGKAKQLQGEITGSMILGTVGDPDSLRLGSLLAALVHSLPLVNLKTSIGHAEELRQQVAAGVIHGAFYIGPAIPRDVSGLALQRLVTAGIGLTLLREDIAVAAAARDDVVIWPHVRLAALLCYIHPKTAEHDPATVATLSALREVWGLTG